MPTPIIELTDKIVPDAYHGTSRDRAEVIVRDGFTASSGDAQYLGDGVYFFESARGYAAEWAAKSFPGMPIAVIHATINLARCLDLHVPEYAGMVQKYAQKLQIEVIRRASPGNPPKPITESFVINFIAVLTDIDTIRAGRSPGTAAKLFPGSHWRIRQEIMICVRNLSCILTVRIV